MNLRNKELDILPSLVKDILGESQENVLYLLYFVNVVKDTSLQ